MLQRRKVANLAVRRCCPYDFNPFVERMEGWSIAPYRSFPRASFVQTRAIERSAVHENDYEIQRGVHYL